MNLMYDDKENGLYNSKSLQVWAKRLLSLLPSDVDCLASSGSSGCAIASAMLVLSDRPLSHFYVRRRGENAHTGYYVGNKGSVIAGVDDIIARGETMNRISDEILLSYIVVCQEYMHYLDGDTRRFPGNPTIIAWEKEHDTYREAGYPESKLPEQEACLIGAVH